jgi:hypothetical protein
MTQRTEPPTAAIRVFFALVLVACSAGSGTAAVAVVHASSARQSRQAVPAARMSTPAFTSFLQRHAKLVVKTRVWIKGLVRCNKEVVSSKDLKAYKTCINGAWKGFPAAARIARDKAKSTYTKVSSGCLTALKRYHGAVVRMSRVFGISHEVASKLQFKKFKKAFAPFTPTLKAYVAATERTVTACKPR